MRPLRILIVEDNVLIGLLLADLLSGMGHRVCAIEDEESAAVAAADRCRPDLMIVDMQLAGGSGVSAVEAISRSRLVPHVFISGDRPRVTQLRPGAVVLEKPFAEPELVRAIQQALLAAASFQGLADGGAPTPAAPIGRAAADRRPSTAGRPQ